jgi:hypothetical protein
MLGLQSKKGAMPILCTTKWGNRGSNIMPTNRCFDHIESQTIVHLEEWIPKPTFG